MSSMLDHTKTTFVKYVEANSPYDIQVNPFNLSYLNDIKYLMVVLKNMLIVADISLWHPPVLLLKCSVKTRSSMPRNTPTTLSLISRISRLVECGYSIASVYLHSNALDIFNLGMAYRLFPIDIRYPVFLFQPISNIWCIHTCPTNRMFADSRYWKKCRYADIADADINILIQYAIPNLILLSGNCIPAPIPSTPVWGVW